MRSRVKIGLLGAEGRMGQALVTEIEKNERTELVCALASPGSPNLGLAIGGVKLSADTRSALNLCDVMIDFSHPKAAIDAALMMHRTACKTLVTGTTGYAKAEEKALIAASEAITLVKSGNFSVGICILEDLVEKAANKLRDGWDIDVLDVHHRHKVDAPSGTALMLGHAAQKGRGDNTIVEYAALRHGGVIGDHSVSFSSDMETLTLSHSSIDRALFAKGALIAALWAIDQDKGLYTMKDVLNL
ncbi:MAG: 4-hydroxy-tetrahydrodipicolinate reductase [Acidimicrobiales bacterium]|nr:4-hydroxy-tetrahydrodipicolinate reductase [Hyphomonadaceae bacterium]RZV44678.1 MAG: 4-hydroxy-tetrahydrodipicolinate reductase [Acidimicrobiales bacterium]